jgi:hypothetical protein
MEERVMFKDDSADRLIVEENNREIRIGHLLEKRQMIIEPIEIGVSSNKFLISDLEGNPLGYFVKQNGELTNYVEDEQGTRIGEIRREVKFGLVTGRKLIFDSLNTMQGIIEGEQVNNNLSTTIVKPGILKNASGQIEAISDSFAHSKYNLRFEGVRKCRLNVRNQSDTIIANIHGIPNSYSVQIDFSFLSKNQLSLLSFILTLII